MDRYLASLRAPSPAYEDPYAHWGGARPALQYGLPPERPRPDATGWTVPLADYGTGHTPAAFPTIPPPPMPANLPGGPRPSTPTGAAFAPPGGAPAFGNPEAQRRYDSWVQAAVQNGVPLGTAQAIAAGGIRWAEENEPDKRPGWSGADLSAYAPNTLNPNQALAFFSRGGLPNQYQWSGRADVGGNATNLTSITPPGGAPEDATRYITDPLDRAAAHVTQALSQQGAAPMASDTGGMRPGNYQQGSTPGYAPAAGAGGAGGVNIPGLGSLTSDQALYLLSDPAAFQAYIASAAGAPIGNQSFRSQFLRGQIVPTVQAAIESLTGLGGETTTDQLGQNIQHYLSMLGGQGGFGALRGEATSALRNPELWGNLGLLKDQEAAQRLNQIIGLSTAGSGDLYGSAMRQRGLNALEQKHLSDMAVPLGQTAPTYSDYFQQLPWVQTLRGGR